MIHTPAQPDNPRYQSALAKRQKLRTLQASRRTGDGRLDKTVREVILVVTGFVAELQSGVKLPR